MIMTTSTGAPAHSFVLMMVVCTAALVRMRFMLCTVRATAGFFMLTLFAAAAGRFMMLMTFTHSDPSISQTFHHFMF
jgi:hypothetical protein